MRYTVLALTLFAVPLFADSAASRLDKLEALVLAQQKQIESLEARLTRQQALVEGLLPRAAGPDAKPRLVEAAYYPSSAVSALSELLSHAR